MGCPQILVVDDSPEFLFMICSVLEFNKINVEPVSNPNDAVKLTGTIKYDLIVLDYIMDEMDGLKLAWELRSKGKNTDVKIILLTTKKLDQDELNKVNSLKLKYIQKPIAPADMVRHILTSSGGRI